MSRKNEPEDGGRAFSEAELQDLVASSDSGARAPAQRWVALLIAGLALFWSLFQVWIAEPQFWFGELPFVKILGSEQTRPMHLALGVTLAFLAYPAFARAPRDRVPLYDWALAALGAGCALYIFVFSRELAATARSGLPTQTQVIVGAMGILVLLEASRRSLGPALTVVASLFLAYSYFGQGWLIPDLIAHQGRSFTAIVNSQWLSTEGVFGIPLGVSTAFVFLFVLFGALLDKGGAGNYFIQMAFAGLGHLRGGPAKAAVVGSAATGLISGSSIANVVTTGTFTIPLMKRVGFTAEKAGAVEVASSVNGQIMPPVMGAAAFLMVEFIGISYLEVIKHAFIPAVISYIALVYIVHLEALKNGMPALGEAKSLLGMLLKALVGFAVAGVLFYGVIAGVGVLRAVAPGIAGPVMALAVLALYLAALKVAARRPDLALDDPQAKDIRLPKMGDVVPTGLYFLLPILVLVWYLMVERQSPAKSAFYAVLTMMVILLTQRPVKALLRGEGGRVAVELRAGFADLIDGMIAGARNMIGIAVATGAAGIIVATVTRTPIGTELAGLVELLSMGNLFLMLLLVGVFSLVLGLGLPTTANYIVVSSLMASVVVSLGAQEGLIVPLIAAHLFVFYFGIMADVTPPVGLASFAAAAVSGGDPIRTGFTAFFYSLRTVALPFLFIYNPALILYGIDLGTAAGLLLAAKVFVVATFAMLLFAAATQGYFLARSRIWESAALLLVAFTLFVPNFWLDRVQPRFEVHPPAEFEALLAAAEEGERLRLVVEGPDFTTGARRSTTLAIDAAGPPGGRLAATGLFLLPEGERVVMEEPMPASSFERKLRIFDFYRSDPVEITAVETPADRMPAEVFYLPALLLLLLVIAMQRRRQTSPAF